MILFYCRLLVSKVRLETAVRNAHALDRATGCPMRRSDSAFLAPQDNSVGAHNLSASNRMEKNQVDVELVP